MYRKNFSVFVLVIMVALSLLLAGCAQTKPAPEPGTAPKAAETTKPATPQTPPPTTSKETSSGKIVPTYLPYAASVFDAAANRKRVLFFHATWCSTCKAADQELTSNMTKIPSDMTVFKVDYDSEEALKEKYGITYQHTFVYVDKEGKEIKKWNGGGLAEIIKNTQ